MTKRSPSATIWSGTPPFEELTNCGRNAKQNSAVCGFSTFTIAPCANTRRNPPDSIATATGDASRLESVCVPNAIRYNAPRYLTKVNAEVDETSSAERPSAAAATWKSVPVQMPSTETSPAMRPCSMLRVTMYRTAGPGVRSSATAAATNTARLECPSMGEYYPY